MPGPFYHGFCSSSPRRQRIVGENLDKHSAKRGADALSALCSLCSLCTEGFLALLGLALIDAKSGFLCEEVALWFVWCVCV